MSDGHEMTEFELGQSIARKQIMSDPLTEFVRATREACAGNFPDHTWRSIKYTKAQWLALCDAIDSTRKTAMEEAARICAREAEKYPHHNRECAGIRGALAYAEEAIRAEGKP